MPLGEEAPGTFDAGEAIEVAAPMIGCRCQGPGGLVHQEVGLRAGGISPVGLDDQVARDVRGLGRVVIGVAPRELCVHVVDRLYAAHRLRCGRDEDGRMRATRRPLEVTAVDAMA